MEAKTKYKVSANANKVLMARVVDKPGEKGMFLEFQGWKVRWKGWPKQENVYAMNFVKSVFSKPPHYLGKKTLKIIVILFGGLFLVLRFINKKLAGRLANRIVGAILHTVYDPLQYYKIEPLKLKRANREIYRLMSILIDREQQPSIKEKWTMLRDIGCKVFEWDNSPLMRLQDIAAEVKLEELKFDEEDKEIIRVRFPWEYRYESIIDYSDYDKGKYKLKAEQLKLIQEEQLMELKAYYEQKMAELQARFQAEKDNLINEMTVNVHKFEARAQQFQQDYQEFGVKLAEAQKPLPEPAEVLPKEITGMEAGTLKVEPPGEVQQVAQEEVKAAINKAEEAVKEAATDGKTI